MSAIVWGVGTESDARRAVISMWILFAGIAVALILIAGAWALMMNFGQGSPPVIEDELVSVTSNEPIHGPSSGISRQVRRANERRQRFLEYRRIFPRGKRQWVRDLAIRGRE